MFSGERPAVSGSDYVRRQGEEEGSHPNSGTDMREWVNEKILNHYQQHCREIGNNVSKSKMFLSKKNWTI